MRHAHHAPCAASPQSLGGAVNATHAAQPPNAATTTDTDSYEPTGNAAWLRDVLDAPAATDSFDQTMNGIWAITTTTAANTTDPSTQTAATDQQPKNAK